MNDDTSLYCVSSHKGLNSNMAARITDYNNHYVFIIDTTQTLSVC